MPGAHPITDTFCLIFRDVSAAYCALSAFLVSKILSASSAAFTPLRAMAPNVGPVTRQFLSLAHVSVSKHLTHSVGTIDLGEFHATNDESGYDLPGAFHDGVLCRLHVKATHAAELLELFHADKALNGEGAEGAVVSGGADDERCVDGVGIHAGLVVMVHRDQSPVGNHTCDAHVVRPGNVTAGDKILDSSGVEELYVGELQHLGQDGGSEESGVLDDDKVAFVLEGNANLGQEGIL
jgi:hypothetical protein